MTAVSSLAAWVVLPTGELVDAVSASLSADEGWSPYGRGTVVIPYTAARAAAVDPRTGAPVVALTIRRSWSAGLRLVDLGGQWAGLTLAGLGAAWAGLTLADLGGQWWQEWESGTRAPDEVTALVGVRERSIDYAAGTITLTLSTHEALAQDGRLNNVPRDAEPASTRILALLTAAAIPSTGWDLSGGDATTVTADPGGLDQLRRTVWDLCQDAASTAVRRLWCDLSGVWHLTDPTAAPTTTVAVPRVERASETVSRDSEWADWLVTRVSWSQTSGGTEIYPVDVYVDSDTVGESTYPPYTEPHRVALVERDHGHLDTVARDRWAPLPAERAARLRRLASRDRVLDVVAPLDPTIRTGVYVTTGAPSLPALKGVVSAFRFDVPADTMTLTLRSVEDA